LQTLSFLAQPTRSEQKLARLKDILRFCHDELEDQEIHVYGDKSLNHLPILPVFVGRPSKASRLSLVLREHGLVASPVSTPAVGIVILSASYTDKDVNDLTTAIIAASCEIGLSRRTRMPRRVFCGNQNPEMKQITEEKRQATEKLRSLLTQQIFQLSTEKPSPAHDQAIISSGYAAQQKFGIGSGSARWVLGTFQPHLELEKTIARFTKQPSALTYADSDLGLMSTLAALCRPVLAAKKHYFLLPASLPHAAEEGLRVASNKSGTVCLRYADLESMVPLITALAPSRDTYISLYTQPLQDGKYIDLLELATRLHKDLPIPVAGV
jgi:7-keto-8-aminopelargonate synthetase-like enzyme